MMVHQGQPTTGRPLQMKFCAQRYSVFMLALLIMGLSSQAMAVPLSFLLNRANGQLYISNDTVSPIVFDGYSVSSASSSIVNSGWQSIADNGDSNSGGSVDATAQWFELSDAVTSISEVSTTALSATVAPGEQINLGSVWSTGSPEDLTGVFSSGINTTPTAVTFFTLAGDYDADLQVTMADFTLFTTSFGSTIDLRADGNGNGIVDIGDYSIWRDSFELLSPSSTSSFISISAISAVPEPNSLFLLLSAGALAVQRKRR